MGEIRITRDFFLWCMSVIYLFAFSSFYVQIPGLYGDNGVLPAKLVLEKEPGSVKELLDSQPTLLRFMPRIGLDVQSGMDFLCLLGMILSFVMMISKTQRGCLAFGVLWVLYFSLFQVGQTFLWFQWDILLLEVGFLTVLVAPFNIPWFRWKGPWHHDHDHLTFWLIRWLLFRLMFASGVVKLQSQCPTWWGLTALNYHYETQCIPTPLAWYAHQLPDWFQKLSVVAVYIIMIPIPFLFFAPVRSLRLFAFNTQIFAQLLILLTGNYNFFNLVTIVLCLSLVDDNYLRSWMGRPQKVEKGVDEVPVIGFLWRLIKLVLVLATFGALGYWAVRLFSLRLNDDFTVFSKIAFTSKEFDTVIRKVLPISIGLGLISLSWETLKAAFRSIFVVRGFIWKLWSLLGVVIFGAAAFGMFAISLVPHTVLDHSVQGQLWPVIRKWHDQSKRYEVANSYGLFRRMTGVGGRPEVIVEGSNDQKTWQEYEFLYKPGNVKSMPPVVAPHQPRLDWQMWFAALRDYNSQPWFLNLVYRLLTNQSEAPHQPRLDWQMWFAALDTYQQNPWFLNMIYRLFTNQTEVLELIEGNPFPDQPPKFIRATLYHYHFTRADQIKKKSSSSSEWFFNKKLPKDWWTRKRVKEYLPIITKDEQSFVNYLKQYHIIDPPASPVAKNTMLKNGVDTVRGFVGQMEGFLFLISLFTAGLLLSFLDPHSFGER